MLFIIIIIIIIIIVVVVVVAVTAAAVVVVIIIVIVVVDLFIRLFVSFAAWLLFFCFFACLIAFSFHCFDAVCPGQTLGLRPILHIHVPLLLVLGLFKIGCQLFVVTVLALLSVLKSWSLINICAMHAPPSPHNKFSRLEPSISWLIIIIIIMLLVFFVVLLCFEEPTDIPN